MFASVMNKKGNYEIRYLKKFGSFTLYRSENLSKLEVHTTIFLKIKIFVVTGKWKIVNVYE